MKYILGLSNKIGVVPFDDSTLSGRVLKKFKSEDISMQNLVQFAPLNEVGKLRYPAKDKLREAVIEFLKNVSDNSIVVCLGDLVFNSFVDYLSVEVVENKFETGSSVFFKVAHPSYIGRFKRKEMGKYIDKISGCLEV